MHLAQALGLYRFRATFFSALRKFIPDANLNRPDRHDAAFELHVMRLAIAARLMWPVAPFHGAGLVFFAHKKAPLS
jgi:hypothetical protein